MPSAPVACRLFVILAREAPVAVIFRRGPSKATQIIKWNTDTDTFEEGSWLHGRLYSERCDLSPDGTKLIYFAANYSYSERNKDSEFPTAWTAISKTLWLTALCAWPNGGTWYGGGVFETDTKVWLNQDFWHHGQVVAGSTLPPDLEVSHDHPFWDHHWHNLFRLERSGWTPIQPYPWGSIPLLRRQPDDTVTVEPTDPNCPLHVPATIHTVHEKANPQGSHSLIMSCTYPRREPDSPSFALRDNQQQRLLPLQDAVWADWDRSGRLLYAREGQVLTAQTTPSGELCSQMLTDFNSAKPKRAKAPSWAREW